MDVSVTKLGLTLKLRMSPLDERLFVLPLNCSRFLHSSPDSTITPTTRKKLSEQPSISDTSLELFPDMCDLEETFVKGNIWGKKKKKQEGNQYLN